MLLGRSRQLDAEFVAFPSELQENNRVSREPAAPIIIYHFLLYFSLSQSCEIIAIVSHSRPLQDCKINDAPTSRTLHRFQCVQHFAPKLIIDKRRCISARSAIRCTPRRSASAGKEAAMKMAVRGFFKGAFFNPPCHSLNSAMFDAAGFRAPNMARYAAKYQTALRLAEGSDGTATPPQFQFALENFCRQTRSLYRKGQRDSR